MEMTLPRLSLLVFLAGCSASQPATTVSPEIPLRVMTFNIQAGGGDLRRIASLINDLEPDVVALQEVDVHWSDRSGFANQALDLGVLLGMQARFAPIYALPPLTVGAPARQYGGAILSRFPIVSWSNDSLTRLSTQDSNPVPRRMPGLLHARIKIQDQLISIVSVHLDYRADPAVRRQQVKELRTYVDRLDVPVVVAGDLNATPDADELAPLFERLYDSWRVWGDGPAGFTYPSTGPRKRIDFVLVSPHFQVKSATVAGTRASDHLPLTAQLLLVRR